MQTTSFKVILLTLSMTLPFPSNAAGAPERPLIRLATTTSTDNSGLLGILFPAFEQETGYKIHTIAIGTGKALQMGRDGDVDVLLVHAPDAELKFIDEGFGEQRYVVMYNDFILVGPPGDPAGLSKAKSIKDAMGLLAKAQAPFVSRGDNSGTHIMEKALWQDAGIAPKGAWYREAGQGMGEVLQMSGEMEGYALTDRGTWLAYADKSPLRIVFEKDSALYNPYSIITIGPRCFPDTNHAGAMALVKWLVSPITQRRIAHFKINGKPLFTPSADPAQQKALGVID